MNEYRGMTRKQLRYQSERVLKEIRINNRIWFEDFNRPLYAQLEKISAALEARPKTWWQLFKEGMAD